LNPSKALLSWSGGKDSALSLYEISGTKNFKIEALLTTLTRDFNRISMHGVRRELLHLQVAAIGLSLEEVWISKDAPNIEYENQMRNALTKYKNELGVFNVIFGDIFLEDIRKYREEKLANIGMKANFPLWKRDTKSLANFFIDSGFKAIVCCVDPKVLSEQYCGLDFDRNFLSKLPPGIDPCGENGEFHTFVYDGPIFREEIKIKLGEIVLRDGFYFADIMPVRSN
jgi:uncharacterized protein (TIGR00290 family)